MKRLLAILASTAAVAVAIPASASAAGVGPPGGMIYAEGRAFQTVGTPSTLPDRGPFDKLYLIDGFAPVSDAAPGDRDYNGGRWQVVLVTGTYSEQPTSEAEVLAGATSMSPTDTRFVCPLIQM